MTDISLAACLPTVNGKSRWRICDRQSFCSTEASRISGGLVTREGFGDWSGLDPDGLFCSIGAVVG